MLSNIQELAPINTQFQGGEALAKESFSFLSQIGSGAFGKVYKVSSKATNLIYALKVLSKNQIVGLKLTDQLKNEIAILARCAHPNIVKLHAAFEDKGYVYLIMELASEGTLYHKLKSSKRLNETLTADYMTDVIRAVAYLHSLTPPIIHRDLKPENVLVGDNVMKIADFGWSNVNDDTRNTFCGTPDYLSPEMILGSGHSEKLDIWTLGVLMYEMLHGRPPFTPTERAKDRRMLQKAIEDNILAGKVDFDNNVSADARAAITAMLQPQDSARPLARDLFSLDFFKSHSKVLNPAVVPIKMQPASSNSAMSLKQKVEQYEKRLEYLIATNKSLSELCEQKDKIITETIGAIERLSKDLAHVVN